MNPVPVVGCSHLKSAVTQAASDAALVNPEWVGSEMLEGLQAIDVEPGEPRAANGLLIGESLLSPSSFSLTTRRLGHWVEERKRPGLDRSR